jgi:hypothetical protein
MNMAFENLQKVVTEARLSATMRQQVLQSLDRLPPLYGDFDRTYDIRYRDGIVRLVEAMLYSLGQDSADSPDGSKVAGAIVHHLAEMHQRLGIPSLGMKQPAKQPAKKAASRKA